MSTDHTHGKLTFSESETEPNRFTVHSNGKWLVAIQHNGEPWMEAQRENMRRLVACWNACEGSSTKWLEFQHDPDRIDQFGDPEPFETRYTEELIRGVMYKDRSEMLLAALQRLASAMSKPAHDAERPNALNQAQRAIAEATGN